MKVFIGTDHRGFELKNKLIEYLQERNIRIEDMGNYDLNPLDDYSDFAQKVAQAVLQNIGEALGIVLCGSGVGVCISANRFRGIRCALGFTVEQIKHARENDHVNVLAIASDYTPFEEATPILDSFLQAVPKQDEKYLSRIKKLDQL